VTVQADACGVFHLRVARLDRLAIHQAMRVLCGDNSGIAPRDRGDQRVRSAQVAILKYDLLPRRSPVGPKAHSELREVRARHDDIALDELPIGIEVVAEVGAVCHIEDVVYAVVKDVYL
jgi:hypothetical protein